MRLLLAIPLLAMQALAATYAIRWRQALQADVFRPDDKVARPAILWCLAGADLESRGLRRISFQRYLDAGFVVVASRHTGSETKWANFRDVKTPMRDRSKGPVLFQADPKRIAGGHSAGGFLTLLADTAHPRPRALVSFCGYGDFADWESAARSTRSSLCGGGSYRGPGRPGSGAFLIHTRQQGVAAGSGRRFEEL